MSINRESQARQVFAAKLNSVGGRLICGERNPWVIGQIETVDFDVRLPDGSIYILRNIHCAAIRHATRDEYIAVVGLIGESDPSTLPVLPYYYMLSFD